MIIIGSADRPFRFILGSGLLIVPFLGTLRVPFADSAVGWLAIAAVGIVLFVTAAFRIRPAYALRGRHACARGFK